MTVMTKKISNKRSKNKRILKMRKTLKQVMRVMMRRVILVQKVTQKRKIKKPNKIYKKLVRDLKESSEATEGADSKGAAAIKVIKIEGVIILTTEVGAAFINQEKKAMKLELAIKGERKLKVIKVAM